MGYRNRSHFLICVAVLVGLSGITQAQTSEDDVQAIHRTYSAWVETTNAKDIESWATFLSDDPFFAPPEQAALDSKEKVLEFYSELFADPNFVGLECQQLDVTVANSRDIAWSRGVCLATFLDERGVAQSSPSKWAKAWVRNENGEWKCRLNTWNTNSSD